MAKSILNDFDIHSCFTHSCGEGILFSKKPSFDVLYKLIRELSISADSIFYPEKPSKDSEIENLLRMLSACDERSLEVVKATVKALIDTAPQE